MFKTTADGSVGNQYVNKDVGVDGTLVDAVDGNIHQDEMVAVVEAGGLVLDPTGVTRDQLAKAMTLISGNAHACTPTTGIVNQYATTPQLTGNASTPTDLLQMNGYLIFVDFSIANTGASFLDYDTLGSREILADTGSLTSLVGGELLGYCFLWYNAITQKWIFLFSAGNTNIADLSITMSKLNNGAEGDNVRDRVAKLWVRVNANSGVPQIQSSFNVDSLTDNGNGRYSIVIDVNMPNFDYSVVGSGMQNPTDSGGNSGDVAVGGVGTGSISVETWDDGGSHGDFYHSSVIVFANT